jgi:hypothetical protein
MNSGLQPAARASDLPLRLSSSEAQVAAKATGRGSYIGMDAEMNFGLHRGFYPEPLSSIPRQVTAKAAL